MMECNWNSSSLPWLARDEQDFPLGAKDASYLPPATDFEWKNDITDEVKNGIFDLPDWMESRDIVVQPNDFLNITSKHHEQKVFENSSKELRGFLDGEEDYGQVMKPEDMLVPLSELQPEKYAPPNLTSHVVLPSSSTPKVAIRVSKVKLPKSVEQSRTQNFVPMNAMQPYSCTSFQNKGTIQPLGDLQNSAADELLNELVGLASSQPNGLTGLIESLDASLVQQGMDELLSQLETVDAKQEMQKPLSPACVPSPVPSAGSLSPESTSDYSYHQIVSPVYYNEVTKPDVAPVYYVNEGTKFEDTPAFYGNEVTEPDNAPINYDHEVTTRSDDGPAVSLPSPLSHTQSSFSVISYGEETSSVASPVDEDLSVLSPESEDEEMDVEYTKPDMHSYSQSPNKSRPKRKSSSTSAYPEGRKERKKEQNKKAALRYRQKKKQEDDELMSKIQAEEERQQQLQKRYSTLKQELTCLKKLMREMLIAKGNVSPDAFKKK